MSFATSAHAALCHPRRAIIPALALVGVFATAPSVHGYATVPSALLVASTITRTPVQVVLWIRNTVTPEDEAWIVAEIEAGLALWESVPTSHLRFASRVVRGPSAPTPAAGQLLVSIANQADLTSGAATLPVGAPGQWRGAVADFRAVCSPPCTPFRVIAAHEIGHAMGLLHSTISRAHFGAAGALMQATPGSTGLTADDVAAVSVAYPNPHAPLATTTGTIRGRAVTATTGAPLDGVNVVAVDTETGIPAVARLSGADGVPGAFVLVGLPPATYALHLLDGTSFTGDFVGLPVQAVQVDNLTTRVVGPFTVGTGTVVDAGELVLTISPLTMAAGQPPAAIAGTEYTLGHMLTGGVRPLRLAGTAGLPIGLAAAILAGPPPGRATLRLRGVPAEIGRFASSIATADAHGTMAEIPLALAVADTLVDPLCAEPLTLTGARLEVSRLHEGGGSLTLRGTIRFRDRVPPTLDPTRTGVEIRVDDVGVGGSTILEWSRRTARPIPPAGAECDPTRDGWTRTTRRRAYRQRSNALDSPDCTPGSARGLRQLTLRPQRHDPTALDVTLRTRHAAFDRHPRGPLRVTITFAAAPAAANAHPCASTHAFSALACTTSARGTRLRCR